MKKNVFSRVMAAIVSMSVIGTVSMMTASAASITGGTVETVAGGTANVPFTFDISGYDGVELEFTAAAPLTITAVSGVSATRTIDGGIGCVFQNDSGNLNGTTVTVSVAADAAPGSYPVNVAIDTSGDGINANVVYDATLVAGTVVVLEPETEATTAPTVADADNTGTPANNSAKPTTVKAAATSAPKTGNAGVAVAVAGLVTAGATAVVLNKKH